MKILLTTLLFSSLIITGCGKKDNPKPNPTPTPTQGGGTTPSTTPNPDGTYTIYLNLGEIGLYEGKKGQDFPSMFLENAIKISGKAGDALPGKDKITSTSGATFSNWMAYQGNGAPTRYDTIPAINNLILLANFTGGSGTIVPPQPGEGYTYTCTGLPSWITDNDCVIFAWAWEEGKEGSWISCTYGEGNKPTELSFKVENEIAGFLLARCAAGTTTPNWAQEDNSAGRVYNKTANIDCTSGTYSYACSAWEEYKK